MSNYLSWKRLQTNEMDKGYLMFKIEPPVKSPFLPNSFLLGDF